MTESYFSFGRTGPSGGPTPPRESITRDLQCKGNGFDDPLTAQQQYLSAGKTPLLIELAPLLSGFIRCRGRSTDLVSRLSAGLAGRLPARRIGTPDDLAQAFMSVMRNGFITGTVLHVDGGHRLT